jgi:hypothetical protein
MPRFALARHDSPRGLHWDFFLEQDEQLRTWALDEPPQHGQEVPCTALGDHRLAYLDYEGPVSDDRGIVFRWDAGDYVTIEQTPTAWIVETRGQWLRGRVTLRVTDDAPERWTFVFTAARE